MLDCNISIDTTANKTFCKVLTSHSAWLAEQEPCVMQLYFYAIASDQYGDKFYSLHYSMSPNSFKKARKALESKNLFIFEEITDRLPSGRLGVVGYKVKNLFGAKSEFWKAKENIITSVTDVAHNESGNQNLIPEHQVLIPDDQNLMLRHAESLTQQAENFSSELIKNTRREIQEINTNTQDKDPNLVKKDQDPYRSVEPSSNCQADEKIEFFELDGVKIPKYVLEKVLENRNKIQSQIDEVDPSDLLEGQIRTTIRIFEGEDWQSLKWYVVRLFRGESEFISNAIASIRADYPEKEQERRIRDFKLNFLAEYPDVVERVFNLVSGEVYFERKMA